MPIQRNGGPEDEATPTLVQDPHARLKQEYPADLTDMILSGTAGGSAVPGAVRIPVPPAPPATSPSTPVPAYVNLDDQWHQQHAPAKPAVAVAPVVTAPAAAPAIDAPPQRAARAAIAVPAPVARPVVVQAPAPQITMVETEEDAEDGYVVEETKTAEEYRSHTPITRLGTTIFYMFLLWGVWLIWRTGARYTVDAVNSAGPFLSRFGLDVASWNTQPFFATAWLGSALTYVPFLGGLGQALAKMPAIWVTPIVISIGEAVLWPRRKLWYKDLLLFWRPLKGEQRWKHYVLLFILSFDVLSTCAGAIIDMVAPGRRFTWSYLWDASPDLIFSGIALGVFCAVTSERLWSLIVREIVGLWIPPTWRIHRWFRPVAYVQYA